MVYDMVYDLIDKGKKRFTIKYKLDYAEIKMKEIRTTM